MEGPEHIPIGPQEAPKRGDATSEKAGEDLPEGDFDIPTDQLRESAGENWSQFGAAQQFIQALRGEEARQHQKEEELAKLLRAYIQQSDHDAIFTALITLLDRNVLASVLIAVLSLKDRSLSDKIIRGGSAAHALPSTTDTISTQLAIRDQFRTHIWDPRVRPELELWLFTIREICSAYPKRLLKDLSHENKEADTAFQALLSVIVDDFLQRSGIQPTPESVTRFAEATLQRLIEGMISQIENQKELQ